MTEKAFGCAAAYGLPGGIGGLGRGSSKVVVMSSNGSMYCCCGCGENGEKGD